MLYLEKQDYMCTYSTLFSIDKGLSGKKEHKKLYFLLASASKNNFYLVWNDNNFKKEI